MPTILLGSRSLAPLHSERCRDPRHHAMPVPNMQIEAHSTIGARIHVIGNSTSGKRTLAARLVEALDATSSSLIPPCIRPADDPILTGGTGLAASQDAPLAAKRTPPRRSPDWLESTTRPTNSSSPRERRSRNSSAASWASGWPTNSTSIHWNPSRPIASAAPWSTRRSDLLWKVRFRGGWLYLLILLEFQSESDPFMALRILTYTCLTYEELIRRGEIKPGNKLPPLLPVAIYNGRPRWRAPADIAELIAPVKKPLAQFLPSFRYLVLDLQRIGEKDPRSRDLVTSLGIMEREPTPENLQRVMQGLMRRFRGPEFAELHQALDSWVAGAAEAWQISKADLARMKSFTEDEEMYERAKELRDQVHRDGVRQGLEAGRIRERAHLVRRLATRKFGAETAERLSRILEDMADTDRIDEVFDAIVDCDSGAELFARVCA